MIASMQAVAGASNYVICVLFVVQSAYAHMASCDVTVPVPRARQ